ncbi:MAG: hypothetical protein JW768_04440 [Chitinispirillaceae bacterium]|nr:hypothetical protein [Chitinispirillaceae bacterium]
MKTYTLFVAAAFLFVGATVMYAAEGDKNTLQRADAIYNEIMMTLPQEMKAKIDSSKTAMEANQKGAVKVDTAKNVQDLQEKAREQKARHLEELPDELREQVEKALQEMEQRQMERKLEFKEMKRGK